MEALVAAMVGGPIRAVLAGSVVLLIAAGALYLLGRWLGWFVPGMIVGAIVGALIAEIARWPRGWMPW
jgi:hypothetical protein